MAFDSSRYAGVSTRDRLWHVSKVASWNERPILNKRTAARPFFSEPRFLSLISFLISSAQSVQNLGLAVVSILAGIIVDSGGYMILEIFFLAWLWGEFPYKL